MSKRRDRQLLLLHSPVAKSPHGARIRLHRARRVPRASRPGLLAQKDQPVLHVCWRELVKLHAVLLGQQVALQ